MRYAILIYDVESANPSSSRPRRRSPQGVMTELQRLHEEPSGQRAVPGRRGAPAYTDCDDDPPAGRPERHDRRAVRGDEGGPRRLLPRRGAGPRRGDRAGRAMIPARSDGSIEVRPIWSTTPADSPRPRQPPARPPSGRRRPPIRTSVVDRLFREESGPGRRDPDPRPRRLRSGRGSGPGRLHHGARNVAGPRRPGQPRSVDHHDRAEPGDRPASAQAAARREGRAPQARDGHRGRACGGRPGCGDRCGGRHEPDRGRPAAPDLHVLPPGPGDGRAGRADAADARRAVDARRSPGPSSSRRRRWPSGSSGRSARSATPGSRIASRRTMPCRTGSTASSASCT